ncbi:hypothetical protein CTZ27_05275 [Streptomyces griseocarneus]|nr:hypothetical protein CTZ27_05275 [Streptomyces griseocarneus]
MDHRGQGWRMEVLAGGDILRQERLTWQLHDALVNTDGLTVGFMEPATPAADGSKGGVLGDVALWAAVGTAARPVSQVLITAIKEWCATERQRKVELTYRGHSVTIPARPDEAQLRLIREFMDRVDENRDGNEGE